MADLSLTGGLSTWSFAKAMNSNAEPLLLSHILVRPPWRPPLETGGRPPPAAAITKCHHFRKKSVECLSDSIIQLI